MGHREIANSLVSTDSSWSRPFRSMGELLEPGRVRAGREKRTARSPLINMRPGPNESRITVDQREVAPRSVHNIPVAALLAEKHGRLFGTPPIKPHNGAPCLKLVGKPVEARRLTERRAISPPRHDTARHPGARAGKYRGFGFVMSAPTRSTSYSIPPRISAAVTARPGTFPRVEQRLSTRFQMAHHISARGPPGVSLRRPEPAPPIPSGRSAGRVEQPPPGLRDSSVAGFDLLSGAPLCWVFAVEVRRP